MPLFVVYSVVWHREHLDSNDTKIDSDSDPDSDSADSMICRTILVETASTTPVR